MTTKEKIEWALRQIHGDDYLQKKCFRCEYDSSPGERNKMLGFALIMVGVPCGVYKTFALKNGYIRSSVGRCGRTDSPDPDWGRFIDEVVSLVDE